MFHQILNPTNNLAITVLLSLIPLIVLLGMLAIFRVSAWLAALSASLVTFVIAVLVWGAPLGGAIESYVYGAFDGVWAVDWITFWGVVIFNTLALTGSFENLQKWLVSQATADIRAQTLLLAWAFGALLEGLVGFGYPWALVAPILIGLGIRDLEAVRVAAIANNAPVSFGALGVPIIALSTVTGLPLLALSASVGKIVAVLALLPPWVLIYLVAGRRGLKEGWPLAIVGSLAYIAGQFPVSQYLGPYLPDIIGSIVCFVALLTLLRFWRPSTPLGFGGDPIEEESNASGTSPSGSGLSAGEVVRAWIPIAILVVVVVAWTGPWSPLPDISLFSLTVSAKSAINNQAVATAFDYVPFIGGTAILASWLLMLLFLRPDTGTLKEVFTRTFKQMWGALLVGVFVFGLAFVFIFSGMSASLAYGFSRIGPAFIVLAPILGWIGVALSGSNTSTNTMFGAVQATAGKLLGFPLLLAPSLGSVGSEVGKPVAPQTASVGVSTSSLVRNEGEVIRHNMGWTLIILAYLILIGVLYYLFAPVLFKP